MNSLNLRQIDGGNIIKQADSGSLFKFELLDENHKKFEEQLGDTATVILKKDTVAVFKKIVAVTDNCVTFNLDKILGAGYYILEIIVGEYVFPSDNRVIITVEKTYGDFEPEYLVKVSYEELKADVDDLKLKVTALEERPTVDTALTKRVEALERKEDKNTVYDDSKLVERIESLEAREDKDTVYDDSDLKHRVTELENRPVAEPYNDIEIKDRLTVLESKQDKDTIYDDTAIKERISALEKKPDNDTIYDDTSLKAQVSELQEKLKSLNTVRRAPTGYTLDRTTVPWTIWFDNGCGMTMPQYGTMTSVYGYGQEQNAYNKNLTVFPLPPIIMSVSHGTLTVEKIKTIEGCGDYWSPSITIINPVRDRDDYDWANARFNKASLEYAGDPYYSYKYVRQQYFIRTMYELGIWSGEIVEEFGATKK